MNLEMAGNIRLETEKCLNRLYRGIECRTCVEQCPAKALSLEGGTLEMNTDTCVGCGQCRVVCPTAAISIRTNVTEVWDAINDPMMGTIVDRTRTKWGKCRPYLLFHQKWFLYRYQL